MKVLFDTSVLVAAMVESHSQHDKARRWLHLAKKKEFELIVCSHTLAELYSVLTTLPLKPRISALIARRLIEENVESIAHVITLSTSDYADVLNSLSEQGFFGGVVYDALILKAAEKGGASRLLTLNDNDFRRLRPNSELFTEF